MLGGLICASGIWVVIGLCLGLAQSARSGNSLVAIGVGVGGSLLGGFLGAAAFIGLVNSGFVSPLSGNNAVIALYMLGGASLVGSLLGAGIPLGIWIRKVKNREGHCSSCGYDMTGNETGKCPECGTYRIKKSHVHFKDADE